MNKDDLLNIAIDFNEWLKEMEEKYQIDKDNVQDIIKQFLM